MPSKKEHAKWAQYNIGEFEKCERRWTKSLKGRQPDFNALVGMYRHTYGAEINFADAGDEANQDIAQENRKILCGMMETIMNLSEPDDIVFIRDLWQEASSE